MMEQTLAWICDACGQTIPHAREGWVEWIALPNKDDRRLRCTGLRIVHAYSRRARGCQYRNDVVYKTNGGCIGDVSLTECQGPDGLMMLLEKIDQGELPTSEVLEVVKRIHIPGYEYSRRQVGPALAEGVIEKDVTYGYCRQDQIQAILCQVACKSP